jgi:hypothetical protein
VIVCIVDGSGVGGIAYPYAGDSDGLWLRSGIEGVPDGEFQFPLVVRPAEAGSRAR